jgi:small-conductance mechanosensitive channel
LPVLLCTSKVIASFAGWLAIMFEVLQYGDRVQLGGIKGDVMDIGVLRTTIMETGQWVDGDLYNGRIVPVMFLKSLYLIIQGISLFMG